MTNNKEFSYLKTPSKLFVRKQSLDSSVIDREFNRDTLTDKMKVLNKTAVVTKPSRKRHLDNKET